MEVSSWPWLVPNMPDAHFYTIHITDRLDSTDQWDLFALKVRDMQSDQRRRPHFLQHVGFLQCATGQVMRRSKAPVKWRPHFRPALASKFKGGVANLILYHYWMIPNPTG